MKGFTLIELLITILIIVLVSGSAIAAYTKFNESQKLEIDVRSFFSSINRLRSRAVFLEYPLDCTGLTSFTMTSATGSLGELDSVYSFANCAEGVRGEQTVKVLESSVFAGGFSVSFLPSTGVISTGLDLQVEISSLKGPQRSKTVTINATLANLNKSSDN